MPRGLGEAFMLEKKTAQSIVEYIALFIVFALATVGAVKLLLKQMQAVSQERYDAYETGH